MMRKVLHETCQQYVARRLLEGWRVISQSGLNVVLQSQDGNILRPVDLRNDVETLRPNGSGAQEYLDPLSGSNWNLVDEASSDEDGTYVSRSHTIAKSDLYALPNSGVGEGVINSVKIYFRFKEITVHGEAQSYIRTENTNYAGGWQDIVGGYATKSKTYLTNPNTETAWTWTQINALQAGVSLRLTSLGGQVRCTQVYVEVDYAPPPTPQAVGDGAVATAGVIARKTSASFGLGSIAIAGSLIKQTSIDVGFNTVAIAGSLIKKTFTGVGSGAIAISGALTTIWTKALSVGAGAVTSAGTLIRKTSTSVGAASLAIAGSLIKKTSASFGQGSVAISGALSPIRYYIKAVGSGVVSSAGALAKTVVSKFQAVGDGAVSIAGSLAKQTTRFRAVGDGAVAITGHAAKTLYQICGGGFVDIRGYITQRSIYKAVGEGAIAIAGDLATVKLKLQSVGQGAISIVGDLTRLPKKMVGAGAIAISGAVTKFPRKLVGSGAVAITGSVAKSISKSVGNAAVSIWSTVNGWLTGPPFRLILTFGQDWNLKLTFDTGDTRVGYEPWQLQLTFKGGGK